MRRFFVGGRVKWSLARFRACEFVCVRTCASHDRQLMGVSIVASSTLVLRGYSIEEGSIDGCKRSLQSESATVTHEGIVAINIVIVGVTVVDLRLSIVF